jgi:hypothetical protein
LPFLSVHLVGLTSKATRFARRRIDSTSCIRVGGRTTTCRGELARRLGPDSTPGGTP